SQDIVVSGVVLGLIAYILRFFGVFIAALLTEGSISESFILALRLSLLSEMGIVFVDALAREGIISSGLVASSTIAVLVSMLLFGVLTPKLSPRASQLEKIMPHGITVFLKNVGKLYVKRVDIAVAMLTPLIKFTTIALVLAYLNSLILNAVDFFKLPVITAVAFSIMFSIVLIIAFIHALRSILNTFLRVVSTPTKVPGMAFNVMLDVFAGGLALALQAYIFYETTQKVITSEALLSYITLIVGVVLIVVLLYELARYYLKLKQYKNGT
ncbi:MAG: hypothetical protein N3E48_01185, partial [Candidatus Bathyarchaeota archaeon]|nr:hypothetical protein [Candidatus Bathyarchaeota archaeon]